MRASQASDHANGNVQLEGFVEQRASCQVSSPAEYVRHRRQTEQKQPKRRAIQVESSTEEGHYKRPRIKDQSLLSLNGSPKHMYDSKDLLKTLKLESNFGQSSSVLPVSADGHFSLHPEVSNQSMTKDLQEVTKKIDLETALPMHESPLTGAGISSSRVGHKSGGTEASASASRRTERSPKPGAMTTEQATSRPRETTSDTADDEDTDST